MKLIVGLGNPGKEYKNTRHNVGFMVLDQFALKHKFLFNKKKFNAAYAQININEEKILLVKPLQYMNLSGVSIAKIVNFFKIDYDDILIIHDDLDISLGKYKLKTGGNDGGNNGVKSIISCLQSNELKRLKMGIGKEKEYSSKDYVLGSFNEEEQKVITEMVSIATEIVEDFADMDFKLLMNKYN